MQILTLPLFKGRGGERKSFERRRVTEGKTVADGNGPKGLVYRREGQGQLRMCATSVGEEKGVQRHLDSKAEQKVRTEKKRTLVKRIVRIGRSGRNDRDQNRAMQVGSEPNGRKNRLGSPTSLFPVHTWKKRQ